MIRICMVFLQDVMKSSRELKACERRWWYDCIYGVLGMRIHLTSSYEAKRYEEKRQTETFSIGESKCKSTDHKRVLIESFFFILFMHLLHFC